MFNEVAFGKKCIYSDKINLLQLIFERSFLIHTNIGKHICIHTENAHRSARGPGIGREEISTVAGSFCRSESDGHKFI